MPKLKQKPETEELLTVLEEEYLRTRDVLIYQKMFSVLKPYARSLILKKTRGKIYLPPELVEEAALESTIKFMSQYEKPDYRTKASFAGLLAYKVLESLYGPKVKAVDQIISLYEHIEKDRGHDTELGDLSESYNFTYLFRPYSKDITDDPANYLFEKANDAIDNIITVIKDIYMSVDLHSFFLVAIAIHQFIEKSKTLEKFKELFFTQELERIYNLSLLEMSNRLKGTA
jgi:hypothetical protein